MRPKDPTARSIEARLLATLEAHPEMVEITLDRWGIFITVDGGDVYRVNVEKVRTTHPGSAVHSEDRPDAGRLPPTQFHTPQGH